MYIYRVSAGGVRAADTRCTSTNGGIVVVAKEMYSEAYLVNQTNKQTNIRETKNKSIES